MNLLNLPNELLVIIASSIETDQDLNAFAGTNHFVYNIANSHLYKCDARRKRPMALSWAACYDRKNTARKSLEAGADIGFLLVEAAKRDSANVLELSLSWEGVDPNVGVHWEDDKFYRTALSWAAEKGFVRIVELLLAAKDISPDSKDAFGQTPLAFAAKHGQTAVVNLLLERLNVDVNSRNINNCTPIDEAASLGHADVVEMLLSHHADPNGGRHGNQVSPLAAASVTLRMVWDIGPRENEAKYLRTIELLLRHSETIVDIRDPYVATLYESCAQYGYDTIFGLLLAKRNGAEANPIVAGGRDLLSWAATNDGHESIMKLFLAEDGVNPDRRDLKGRTPLSYAAGNRYTQAAEEEHQRGEPLDDTSARKIVPVVEILLAHPKVDPSSSHEDQVLILIQGAAKMGYTKLMELLVLKDDRYVPMWYWMKKLAVLCWSGRRGNVGCWHGC